MFEYPLIHDDRYEIRAMKTKVLKSGKVHFPLNEPILESELIRVVDHYTFNKEGKEIEARIYGFDDSVIQKYKIKNLEGVRLRIHRNTIAISLSNILNVKYDKSRYQILYDVIYELLNFEVIKYDLQDRTLDEYIHYLLSLFTNAVYEIRIDWNREKGLPILDQCRFKSIFYKQGYNSVALSNQKKGIVKKSGYFVRIYDRAKHKNVIIKSGKIIVDEIPEGHYSEEFSKFPVRLEIVLFKKNLPRELLSCTAKDNIELLDYQINLTVVKNPYYPIFRSFFNCIWFKDYAVNLSVKELQSLGSNSNQYRKSVL